MMKLKFHSSQILGILWAVSLSIGTGCKAQDVTDAAKDTGSDSKTQITQAQSEQAKKIPYADRIKAQKLARTILLALPNPRGQILAEGYDAQGKIRHTALAKSRNGRYLQISFAPIIKESNPIKIYAYAQAQVNWINQTLGHKDTLSEYDALTYFEHRRWIPLRVGSMLTDAEVKKLARITLPEGLEYLDMPIRFYPQGSLAGHVLGAVKRSAGWPLREFQKGDTVYPPIEGISGLEKTQNEVLNGEATVMKYEFDDNGILKKPIVVENPGRPGRDVVLSLDFEMQRMAETLLKRYTAKSGTGKGAMVVIDTQTMQIKALASWPVIDPNAFVPVLNADVEAKWKADKNNPLLARAFQAAYPPASTFKLLTAYMALNTRTVSIDSEDYRCYAGIKYDNNVMKNWTVEKDEYGQPEPYMNVTTALKRSCNTWFFQASNDMLRAGSFDHEFHQDAPAFGLGLKTGLGLNEEVSGFAYVKDNKKQLFSAGAHVANVSIGQGDLSVTPVQLAQMVARIANPAQLNKAHLVRASANQDGDLLGINPPTYPLPDWNAYALKGVRQGMYEVVYGKNGTGPEAQAPNFYVLGKTGTAEWGEKDGAKRNVVWFASYAGGNNPKYAVVAMQEGNYGQTKLSGGNDAAPIVGDFYRSEYIQARMADHMNGKSPEEPALKITYKALPVEEDVEDSAPPVATPVPEKKPLKAIPVEDDEIR